jgi:hypothetical protein
MSGGSFAVVPILGVLMAVAYRRWLAARGLALAWRLRLVFGLMVFAVIFPAYGLIALSKTPVSPAEWGEAAAILITVGAVPLGIFLAFDIPLRLVRRWEASRAS